MCLSPVLSSVGVDTVDLDDGRALGEIGGDDDLSTTQSAIEVV